MNLETKDDGVRPAGKPDECFYCHSLKGEHQPSCVCNKRTVVVKLHVECIVTVPQDFDKEMIEFVFNQSSSCLGNILNDLDKQNEEMCICNRGYVDFLREATEHDHERYGFKED